MTWRVEAVYHDHAVEEWHLVDGDGSIAASVDGECVALVGLLFGTIGAQLPDLMVPCSHDPGLPDRATVRHAVDTDGAPAWHLECRWGDREKWAPVEVYGGRDALVWRLCGVINGDAP